MTSNTPAKFETRSGVRFYRIPITVFPNGFVGYSYLMFNAGPLTLIDAGSGFPQSNEELLQGIESIRDEFGEKFALHDIQRIIVTHGHIDHFGGVGFILDEIGGAEVGIHQLDRRVLTSYEERVTIATKDLWVYLQRAGISDEQHKDMIRMYGFAKKHFRSVDVHFNLEEDTEIDGMRFIHAPGHCPGQVCIQVDEILISADHILSHTTPHQAPESITHYTGLGHYLDSLRRVSKLDNVELALGGHEDPIHDLYGRIKEIEASHQRKLNRVLDIITQANEPITIAQITESLYPNKSGYDVLLALEEAGAHVEYLYEHGHISVANLNEIETEDNPSIKYNITN